MPGVSFLEIEYHTDISGLAKTGIDARTFDKVLHAIAEKVGAAAGSLVSDPPIAQHKPLPIYYTRQGKQGAFKSKFKSLEQQKFFFGVVLKSADFPYTRGRGSSEQLTAQLGLLPYTIRQNGRALIIEAGVNASYAPLVVGDENEQSHYHEGVWTPLMEDIASNTARVLYLKVIRTELQAAIVAFSR